MSRFRVVLVSPLFAGNLRAVARSAANFDCDDVVLVNPQVGPNSSVAAKYAVGKSRKVLESFTVVKTLQEALAGSSLSIAFSKKETPIFRRSLTFDEFLEKSTEKDFEKIALVFGKEDNGLSNEDTMLCNFECPIPTSPEFFSMNLSHAVTVVLFSLYNKTLKTPVRSTSTFNEPKDPLDETAGSAEVTELVNHFRNLMIDAEITVGGNPDKLLSCMNSPLRRAILTKREIGHFRTFLSKTQTYIQLLKDGKK